MIGIDRFLAEIRAVTNLFGNAVATVVIASWEKAINWERANRVLNEAPDEIEEKPAIATRLAVQRRRQAVTIIPHCVAMA